MVLSWLRKLRAHAPSHQRANNPRRLRPRLEILEDRLAPATLTVTSLADNLDVDGQINFIRRDSVSR